MHIHYFNPAIITTKHKAFTLIELSIVLVIIGLLVGGVLVGRDLITSSQIRAQISQIEQYKTAVQTFKLKYNGLPGDLLATESSSFGLTTRSGAKGWGDNNGVIEGAGVTDYNSGIRSSEGELCLMWIDLAQAGLIQGNYTGGTAAVRASTCVMQFASASGAILDTYFPKAKLGVGNYLYAFSGGVGDSLAGLGTSNDHRNYLGITAITSAIGGYIFSSPGATPAEAYNIDSKIDNGLPETGRVQALYSNSWNLWSLNDWQTNITTSTTKCWNSGNNVYYISNPNKHCHISFMLDN